MSEQKFYKNPKVLAAAVAVISVLSIVFMALPFVKLSVGAFGFELASGTASGFNLFDSGAGYAVWAIFILVSAIALIVTALIQMFVNLGKNGKIVDFVNIALAALNFVSVLVLVIRFVSASNSIEKATIGAGSVLLLITGVLLLVTTVLNLVAKKK